MKEINIKINGMDNLVKVQRYFSNEDGSYLIYSQDESDSDGNVKIYVAKVVDNNQVIAINTPEEWDRVKKTIVGIINDNKEFTKLDVQDLDSKVLNNLEITDVRALRLPNAVMQYLSANQPEFSTIDLSENEKALEEKTESLKNMNVELNTMLNNVQTSTVASEEVSKEEVEEKTLENSEVTNEEKMSATMEIIMPTKQTIHNNNEEHPKKKKGKFNFKSLFGIKEDEEEDVKEENVSESMETPTEPIQAMEEITNSQETVTPPVEPIVSIPQVSENVEEEVKDLENKIVDKSELPDPTPLNPIVVENSVDSVHQIDVQPINIEPIIPEPILNNNQEAVITPIEPSKEEITNDNSGFDFFDNLPKPSIATNVQETVAAPVEPVSQMEVLTLEEDLKYKKLYEESEEKIKELENKIFEMEKSIEIYEAKLKEIKNITQ